MEINDDTRPVPILFVGDFPSKEESIDGKPFVGISGGLLRRVIKYVSKDTNFALSHVCRCNPSDGQKRSPTEKEINICLSHLKTDIQKINPIVIVPLGALATKALLKKTELSDIRGQIFRKKRIYIPTLSPGFILKNLQFLKESDKSEHPDICRFVHDLMMAFVIANNHLEPSWGEPGEHRVLTSISEIDDFLSLLMSQEADVAFDTETENLNRVGPNKILSIQFSFDNNSGVVIPIYHRDSPFSDDEKQLIKERLIRLFTEKPKFKHWIAHNAVFDQHIVVKSFLGHPIRNRPVMDTMCGAYLLNDNKALKSELKSGGLGLKSLAKEYLGFFSYEDDVLSKRKRGELGFLDLETFAKYGAMDVYVTRRLFEAEKRVAEWQDYYQDWYSLLRYLFHPVNNQIVRLEQTGFYIDKKHTEWLKSKDSPLVQQIANTRNSFKSLASVQEVNKNLLKTATGGSQTLFEDPWIFDPQKPAHLKALFFDNLLLDPVGYSKKTEQPQLDKPFLKEHKDVEEVQLLTIYRKLTKLISNFVEPILRYLEEIPDCMDGRVRSFLRFTSTVSGRTSSDDPPMQTIPKAKGPDQILIKNIFKAYNPRAN